MPLTTDGQAEKHGETIRVLCQTSEPLIAGQRYKPLHNLINKFIRLRLKILNKTIGFK